MTSPHPTHEAFGLSGPKETATSPAVSAFISAVDAQLPPDAPADMEVESSPWMDTEGPWDAGPGDFNLDLGVDGG